MIWANANDFFAMGGYGLYVWGSYGVAALLMAAEALLVRRRHRDALAQAYALGRTQAEPRQARELDPNRKLKA